jgi:hypothetical protein
MSLTGARGRGGRSDKHLEYRLLGPSLTSLNLEIYVSRET